VTLAGILRDGKLHTSPEPDFLLEHQDIAGGLGKRDQLEKFRELSTPLSSENGMDEA